MKSPWSDLRQRSYGYVLPQDRDYVDAHNRAVGAFSECYIEPFLVPEPFLGPKRAGIVLLYLNPGVDAKTREIHQDPAFVKRLTAAVKSEEGEDHLHMLSDPSDAGGGWWSGVCAPLRLLGYSERHIARNVLGIEFMPYHSEKFGAGHLRLPSQQYSFWLVKEAVRRGATIIIMRGERLWTCAVPDLLNRANVHVALYPRVSSLSIANIGLEAFTGIRRVLDS